MPPGYLCLWQGSARSFAGTIEEPAEFTRTKPVTRSLTAGSYLPESSKSAWMIKLRRTMRTCQCFLKGCSSSEGYDSLAGAIPVQAGCFSIS